MKFRSRACKVYTLFLTACLFASVYAADSNELLDAYNRMSQPVFDTSRAYNVTNLVIARKDFRLTLHSGIFYPFESIQIDSQPIVYGGYFDGDGRLEFTPGVSMEKEQLRRSFGTDSIDRQLSNAQLIFDQSEYEQILNTATRIETQIPPRTQQAFDQAHRFLANDHSRYHILKALKTIAQPAGQPYLLVNTDLGADGQVLYRFDPYARQEVNLLRHLWKAASGTEMLTVCSYSQYLDPFYTNINGMDKSQLAPKHYAVLATVDKTGAIESETTVSFQITKPVQIASFNLQSQLTVDSVLDSTGSRIAFVRPESESQTSAALHLIFDHRYDPGQPLALRFFYHGNLANKNTENLYVDAGANWYPVYGYHYPATFDITTRTPKSYDFIASGREIESKQSGDKLITHWTVNRPSTGVSFSFGKRDKFHFRQEGAPPTEIHYSRSLHNDFAGVLSRQFLINDTNIVDQTASDIINAANVFNYYFGPCIQPKLVAEETLRPSDLSFPGIIRLEFDTWLSFDEYPDDRLRRAVEVARQWWGNAVTAATPQDVWLSQGFAEYSALLYLQQAANNDAFTERLDRYRDQLFASASEMNPLGLGNQSVASGESYPDNSLMSKKGAFILHMLRNLLLDPTTMNEDRFLAMMREWYSTGKSHPMTTLDFKLLTEEYTGIDMDWFFDEWVYGTALPTYQFSYTSERDDQGRFIVTCHIEQHGVPDNFKMYVPLEIEFVSGSRQYLRLLIDQPSVDLELPPIVSPVRRLNLNPFHSVLARLSH